MSIDEMIADAEKRTNLHETDAKERFATPPFKGQQEYCLKRADEYRQLVEILKDYKRLKQQEQDSITIVDKIKMKVALEKLGYPPSAGYYRAIAKVLQIIDECKKEYDSEPKINPAVNSIQFTRFDGTEDIRSIDARKEDDEMIHVNNIIWDIDLPTEVDIPENLKDVLKDADDDAIIDWLSDTYGFCVRSCDIEKEKDAEEEMPEVLTDIICDRLSDYCDENRNDTVMLAAYYFMRNLELTDDLVDMLHKCYSDACNDVAVMAAGR